MFDDTFYITHRLAGRQDLGKQRARDGRSVCFEEKRAFSKLTVRLTGFWSRTPDGHGMAIILKDCLLHVTDEHRYRQQLEDAIRRPQTSRSRETESAARRDDAARWNQPSARLRAGIDPPRPGATVRLNSGLSIGRYHFNWRPMTLAASPD